MDINEIKSEISELEKAETNWQNVQRLAWLYTVHDHIANDHSPLIAYEQKSVMPKCSGEFGECVSGVNIDDLMNILSEHMSVIKILHPKEYQSVLNRILEIPR